MPEYYEIKIKGHLDPSWSEWFAGLTLTRFNGTQPIYTRVTLSALRGNRRVSSALAVSELDYTARPLTETVHDMLTWFLEQRYLTKRRP